MSLSRRRFLRQAGAFGTGALAISIGLDAAASNFTTTDLAKERVILKLPALPKPFSGYKIAFLTDPHIGPWVASDFAEHAVDEIMTENPDLILLGGDFVWVPDDDDWRAWGIVRNEKLASASRTHAADITFSEVGRILSRLKAKDGVYAVLGNHDNWVGPRLCREYLLRDGFRLLDNEQTLIKREDSRITIVGTDDYMTGIPKLPTIENSDSLNVLLTHNPDAASWALRKDYPFHLSLSGHTHGGQIHGRIFGAPTYNVEDLRFKSGLASVDERYIYTSRGLGVVEVPYRINCRPEVTIITLDKA